MAAKRSGKSAKSSAKTGAPPLPIPPVLLAATTTPAVVKVPRRTAVAIDGEGPPDAPAFGLAIGALYGAAYGLKFSRKPSGRDFKVGPLEGLWSAVGVPHTSVPPPPGTWRWRLRLAVPDDVKKAELTAVMDAAVHRKGGKLEGSAEARRVVLERIPAAKVGLLLHVGPYADEPASFARLEALLSAQGLQRALPHVELYLSDPRRTKPNKLKTVLWVDVSPAARRVSRSP